MVVRKLPSRPTGKIEEAESKSFPDGSAFLVYSCGALVLVGKRALYSVNPSVTLVDVGSEFLDAECLKESSAVNLSLEHGRLSSDIVKSLL